MPQRLLRPLLPSVPYQAVGPAAHLCHLPLVPGGDACGLQGRKGEKAQGKVWRKLSPTLPEHWEETRRSMVDLRPHAAFQNRGGRDLRLPSLPHLRGVRLPLSNQVQTGPVSQHCGLLHLSAHREENLHPLHGGHQPGLRPALHLRGHLPGGKTPPRVCHWGSPLKSHDQHAVQRIQSDGIEQYETYREKNTRNARTLIQRSCIVRHESKDFLKERKDGEEAKLALLAALKD